MTDLLQQKPRRKEAGRVLLKPTTIL